MKNTRHTMLFHVCLLLLLALWTGTSALAGSSDTQIAKQAWPMIQNGSLLIDVRTAGEFAAGHLDGAINIEYERTGALMAAIGDDKQRPVVLYCRSGRRVGIAIAVLESKGYTNLFNARNYAVLKETKPSR